MDTSRLIDAFSRLGHLLQKEKSELHLESLYQRALLENSWFTPDNIDRSLEAIISKFLDRQKLEQWLSSYDLQRAFEPKVVGIVMAGNLPLVGWHDIMCVLVSGHAAQIKLSSKDKLLPAYLLEKLQSIEPEFSSQIRIADQLSSFDAVIATGSNNTARYFEYYFGKYPHIIRKTRNSVAVLTGEESPEELRLLGEDVFSYFGLGCRNVSKLYVPKGYDFSKLYEAMEPYAAINEHHKYRNNYEYHKSLLLLNRDPHLDNGFLMLREHSSLYSPMSTLHYSYYSNMYKLDKLLQADAEGIQCVVSVAGLEGAVLPGTAQLPELWDYADGVDTLKFLLEL